MKKFESVEEYLALVPEENKGIAREMRRIIRETVPEALEKISYGMPYYGYKGRLAYFAITKDHVGLYIPPPIVENFKEELKGYKTAKATIQFPFDHKLPEGLIKRMIKERMKLNESNSHI